MPQSHHRARILTGAVAALGALAITVPSASASPRQKQADARTAAATVTVSHRRKGLTSWRTQRRPNPTAPADAVNPNSSN